MCYLYVAQKLRSSFTTVIIIFVRSPSPPPNEDRYTHKTDRRHNLSSSARSDTSNRGRTRRDRGIIEFCSGMQTHKIYLPDLALQ